MYWWCDQFESRLCDSTWGFVCPLVFWSVSCQYPVCYLFFGQLGVTFDAVYCIPPFLLFSDSNSMMKRQLDSLGGGVLGDEIRKRQLDSLGKHMLKKWLIEGQLDSLGKYTGNSGFCDIYDIFSQWSGCLSCAMHITPKSLLLLWC